MMHMLKDTCIPFGQDVVCMVVISLSDLKFKGVSALDFAKTLFNYNMHPPTMYFPLIGKALMVEPTDGNYESLDEL